MNGRVLVLNTSFEPINVCTERRAVVMIFKGVARVEEHNGHMLHSQKLAIHAPSVIRLTEYIHIPFERRSLSRKNILLRDHSTCQYCGGKLVESWSQFDALELLRRANRGWSSPAIRTHTAVTSASLTSSGGVHQNPAGGTRNRSGVSTTRS